MVVESLNNHLTPLPFQISDLLFLLVCVPFTAADYALTSVWYFGEVWCKLNQTFIICTAYVSIYTLVLMATDRSVWCVWSVWRVPFIQLRFPLRLRS